MNLAEHSSELEARVDAVMESAVEELTRLVAIPSVSSLNPDQVVANAEHIADLASRAGAADVAVVTEGQGLPVVIAHWPAPEGAPTVLLYSHGDVQPTGDLSAWGSEPFTATRRGDRLYGRGTADDKGGVAAHLAAIRALGDRPPVGITLLIEGEEEIGSPSMAAIIAAHRSELAADVIVIADAVNWEQGVPSLTTSLRGVADCTVEVRTLDHPLHSGQFGGVVPDALTTLCRLLATLHDENGDVAVEGLGSYPAPDLEYPEDRLRAETAILDGVEWTGTGSLVERMWTRPSISVLAIDATPVAQAVNILPAAARAKVSLRVAPGDDAGRALEALTRHLESHVGFGAHVSISAGQIGAPGLIGISGPAGQVAEEAFRIAWGHEPVEMGCGGAIPLITDLQQTFPEATVLVTAVTDPDSRMHGIDESLHLGDFRRAILTEVLLLTGLADLPGRS
ncbi:dipeptidase [Acidipropionibacterium jensenii]|uniref:Succinyl-diaminopimelate desuccinylase n=1 Tax=Acidipropionibacterium jensenii TaxID=1749 RepID=A0A3S4V818_9ACTN|nr:dipeptidase [Acidipropionibacterium jensenii]MDN5978635.1 dipeptidase [Acidipropionibacterium jensenii]MDN6021477.1 dipeptidase [Acidipropionibacterium jensenii]MDN6426845.1 dipeptidase [Acidipropionibacterium jensenii]MDN6440683.1 dipeptidase [Acidipropionibacterium jensenii]MDN6481353.1 dipeptidase [Acidipropionibacterium jensenii]